MNDMSVGFNRALKALGLPNPALDHKAAPMALSLSAPVAYIHQSAAGAWSSGALSSGAFFLLNCSIFTLLSWMQLEFISKQHKSFEGLYKLRPF